jgi:GT2 family glycosyltransferase
LKQAIEPDPLATDDAQAAIESLSTDLDILLRQPADIDAIRDRFARLARQLEGSRQSHAKAQSRVALLEAKLGRLVAAQPADKLPGDIAEQMESALREAAALRARDEILSSTTWRATSPLRSLADKLPVSVRRILGRAARILYWTVTLQLPRKLRAIRQPDAGLGPDDASYQAWIRDCDTLTDADRAAIGRHIAAFDLRPLISVVMPCYQTSEPLLRAAIASVQGQLYQHWELCIADDASPSMHVGTILRELAALDPRIKWMRRDTNGHIARATNSALALATGEFVALMDHDDLLAETALYEVASEVNAHPQTDLLYSDSDLIDIGGRRHTPYFKTDWSPDLFLAHNLFSHLGVYRRALLKQIGGVREGLDGSQDYDLALRAAALTDRSNIRHIPAMLYHWRRNESASSFSQAHYDRCIAAAQVSVRESLRVLGGGVPNASVVQADIVSKWQRVRWALPDPLPRITLIVLTRDRADLLERCTEGLLHRTDYPDIELVIVANSTDAPTKALLGRLECNNRVRLLQRPGEFNYSALNNAAAAAATGDIIVLIDNDIDVSNPGWLREMVSHAIRPEIGAVGAKLLNPDHTVQHAGMVLGIGAFNGGPGIAVNLGAGHPRQAIGYYGQLLLTRDVSAVTGACLAVRKKVFEDVGGLNDKDLPVAFSDIDLCLRIGQTGLRNVFTPYAELFYSESATRSVGVLPEQADREYRYMRSRWGKVLDNDPFYNPNFSRNDADYQLALIPLREKPWRPYKC